MEEIKNPSKIFLEERLKNIPGSAIVVALEGTRPLLVEIQALVVPTKLPIPKKVGSGVSFQRLQIISALLEKHLNLPLSSFDIYINVSGGFKIQEPAVDLGIALAVISSFKNRPLPENSVCLGELGLLGEIREASAFEKRVKEAKRLGFDHIISRRREKELTRLVQKIWPKNF